ncbi:pre-mRNA-splicing factor CWC22 homolog, partial [Myotis lucifugus]|uniref:pre-mRNA-splicing factor CWC22 homolog n=1 Tax=Myotis lucifugus TaxID=59463 RepID=UPI000CCC67CE
MHPSDVQTFLQGRTGGRWLLTPSSWPQLLSFGNALLGVASANDQARGATRTEIFAKYKTLLLGVTSVSISVHLSEDPIVPGLTRKSYDCAQRLLEGLSVAPYGLPSSVLLFPPVILADRKSILSENSYHLGLVIWTSLRSLIDRINWQQKMKSSVAQIKHSSGHDRRENNSSYQRTISPEDRYAEQERSPRDRDYFEYSRSDNERSRRGRSYDGSMESRSRDREKRRERERDVDRKRYRRSSSPGRRSPEPSVTQSSSAQDEPTAKKKKEELDPLLTRTGGAYIPPAKLRMMQEQITDKN